MENLKNTVDNLLADIAGNQQKLSLISSLPDDDVQYLVDCLDRLRFETNHEHELLSLLLSISASKKILPASLQLTGIHCNFLSPEREGGFCQIYKGLYQGETVCVKVYRVYRYTANSSKELEIQVAATKEVILWSYLSHPNILPFYGVLVSPEFPAICPISPWMENGNLVQFLKTYSQALKLPLISDVISGLHYLHQVHITHGDLKGTNILISDDKHAVICDFGLSHVAEAPYVDPGEEVRGTMNWMAPELVVEENGRPATAQSDIWSFGCVCYEIFTGRTPFHEYQTFVQALAARLRGHITPITCGHTEEKEIETMKIDGEIQSIMEECWKEDPAQRPTADNIRSAISGLGFADDRTPIDYHPIRPVRNTDIDYNRLHHALNRALGNPLQTTPEEYREVAGRDEDFVTDSKRKSPQTGAKRGHEDQTVTGLSQSSPQLVLQISELGRHPGRSATLERVWPYVKAALDRIMSGFACDALEVRGVVRDFMGYARREKPGELEDFYSNMEDYFSLYVDTMVEQNEMKFEELNGLHLLQYYLNEWQRYKVAVEQLELPFSHWDRYWVKRLREEGRVYLHGSRTLALLHWKIGFLESIQGEDLRVTKVVLDLLEQQRNGEPINKDLPRIFIDSLIALEFDDTNPQCQRLDFYLDNFEGPFLESTTKYYTRRGAVEFAQESVIDYLKTVEGFLREEEMSVAPYLPDIRRHKLLSLSADGLIGSYTDLVCGEFRELLAHDHTEHLQLIYTLMSRVAGGVHQLETVFGSHLTAVASVAVARITGTHGSYTLVLLDFQKQHLDMVKRTFNDDSVFVQRVNQVYKQVLYDQSKRVQHKRDTPVSLPFGGESMSATFVKYSSIIPSSELEMKGYPDLTGLIKLGGERFPAHTGGYQDVYIGFLVGQPSLKVAIKVLRTTNEDDQIETIRKHLNREAAVWHKLKHANVLPFLGLANDLGRFENCPALIAPYCLNGTSGDYVRRTDPNIKTRILLVFGIARGLRYLHEKEIVHGDLKPSNVLISDDYEPLLCDFGRSAILGLPGFTTKPTGAIRYQARELIDGVVTPNKSTDVCAFGLTALDLWTGLRPYSEIQNENALARLIIMDDAQPQLPYPPPVMAKTLWPIFAPCLSFLPRDRPDIDKVVQQLGSCT